MRSTREAARLLLAAAQEQGGYFTAQEARRAGYGYPHMKYHVSTGAFERVAHGVYRLSSIPTAENEDLIRLSLWSRNRAGEPQAVVSHESALILHDLTDLLPNEIHLTVPPRFRKQPPFGCVLHRAVLHPRDVEERTGFGVTTALRTLVDAAAGSISEEQLEQAVTQAVYRGLVRGRRLAQVARDDPRLGRLERILNSILRPWSESGTTRS